MPENNPYPESDDIRLNSTGKTFSECSATRRAGLCAGGITAVLVAVVLFIGWPGWSNFRTSLLPGSDHDGNPPVRIFARSSGKISLLLAGINRR